MTRRVGAPGRRYSRYARGFTLIELMVSLTIGLIISVSVIAAYLGTAASGALAEAQARMNEDAQAALTILTQQLRISGTNFPRAGRTDTSRTDPVYNPYPAAASKYSTTPASFLLSDFSIRGCDGTFSNVTSAATLDTLQCAGGPDAAPDSIAVSYQGDAFNTVQAGTNLPSDCAGAALAPITVTFSGEANPGPFTYYVADNRFYIGPAGATRAPTLFCKGNGVNSVAQPLVENVEDMQLSYGAVALATPLVDLRTANVAGSLNANAITGLTGVSNDPMPWQQVITVQICLLVRSDARAVTDSTASGAYFDCNGALTAAPDRRLRRAYHATVVLRNRRT